MTDPLSQHFGNEDDTTTPAQRTRYRQIVDSEARRLLRMKNRARRMSELETVKDRYDLETEVGRLRFGIRESILAELEKISNT